MTSPRAKCSALLRPSLTVCDRPHAEHDRIRSHEFQAKPHHKIHIGFPRLDVMYCGRHKVHEALPDQTDSTVREAALDNALCTVCFKTWLFLRERQRFLLQQQVAAVRR